MLSLSHSIKWYILEIYTHMRECELILWKPLDQLNLSDRESLKQQIDAQGTKVRELKSSGADKVRERERERGRFIND